MKMPPVEDIRMTRAAACFGPKLTAQVQNGSLAGHWVDDRHYFYVADSMVDGCPFPTPMVYDAERDAASSVIEPTTLMDAVTQEIGAENARPALASADFELPDHSELLVHLPDRSLRIDLRDGSLGEGFERCPSNINWSCDGSRGVFFAEAELWARKADGTALQLSNDSSPSRRYASHPDTALFPISAKLDRYPVGLWSPSGRFFLTHRIDETRLREGCIVQHVGLDGRPAVHRFKQCLAGDEPALGMLVAFDVLTGATVISPDLLFDVTGSSPFVQRRIWFASEEVAHFLLVDRFEREVSLVAWNLSDNSTETLITETVTEGSIDLHPICFRPPNIRVLGQSGEIIWYSERDGWGHLYRYDRAGNVEVQLTQGRFQVFEIVHIDEAERSVLFLAAGVDRERDRSHRSLCRVDLDGANFEVLYSDDGDVSLVPAFASPPRQRGASDRHLAISPDGGRIALRSGALAANRFHIFDVMNGGHRQFAVSDRRELPEARSFAVPLANDAACLYGTMFLPPHFDETRRYPLVDYIYPGPHICQQPQGFASAKAAHAFALAELGIITLMLDTRATPMGNREFRHASYGALVDPQVDDHITVIEELLRRHPYLDRSRVGIMGQSAGGAAAVEGYFRGGDLFSAAVGVSGCYFPDLYSASWADKYLGPKSLSTPLLHLPRTAPDGALLLVSGDMDDNVPVSQTFKLVDRLIDLDVAFDLLIVPNAGHDLLNSNPSAAGRIWNHFTCALLGQTFPLRHGPKPSAAEMARFTRVRALEAQS